MLVKEEYDSRPIDLLQKAEVPADCTVLVVAGPKTAVGVPLTVHPEAAPVEPFHTAVSPAGEAPVNMQT